MGAAGTALHLGVFAGDELAGSVVLNRIDRAAGTAGIGYWSAPWARGRRVAERAGRALLTRAFAEGLRRIDWQATVGNHASRLTALRLGFTMIGEQPGAGPAGPDRWLAALRPGDPGVGEVGFVVSPGFRGRGHAVAAVREICRWGFAELGLSRIEWRAEVGNDASRRVAEQAGFTLEGLLRQALRAHGERRDCWVGALLKDAVKGDG